MGLLGLGSLFPGQTSLLYPLRVALVTAALLFWSRDLLSLKPSHWFGSIFIGIAVFVIWIGPDLLWPSYRSHWLLQNQITGRVATSISVSQQNATTFIVWRVLGSAVLVPAMEELFWRAWLMRFLISREFLKVPLGTYRAQAFWITAVLFASEHGPYWDVGLAAGVIYNWWMVRTRNIADCILAHAVTNACLAAYVLLAGKWQYWP